MKQSTKHVQTRFSSYFVNELFHFKKDYSYEFVSGFNGLMFYVNNKQNCIEGLSFPWSSLTGSASHFKPQEPLIQ